VLVPALFALPLIYGLDGVLYAGPVSDFISFAVTAPFLLFHLKRLPADEIAKTESPSLNN